MTEERADALRIAIDDAVAAFDAANLTWGQFYQHVWRRRPAAEVPLAQSVREAMGEAALCVPQGASPERLREFVQALEQARDSLDDFLGLTFDEPLPGDIRDLPALIEEAVSALTPFL
jgi:hypothetical protein